MEVSQPTARANDKTQLAAPTEAQPDADAKPGMADAKPSAAETPKSKEQTEKGPGALLPETEKDLNAPLAASNKAAIGRSTRASSISRHAMRRSKPSPRNKTRELLQIVAMSLMSMTVTLIALWWLDLLSSGAWDGQGVNRVIFTGVGLAIARDQLQTPTRYMPPTLIAFYSETCLHCVKMRRPFLHVSNEFKQTRFVAIKLGKDHDKNVELAKSFGVTHVPTVFFTKRIVNEQGKVALKKVKYIGGAQQWDLRNFIKTQLEEPEGQSLATDVPDNNDKEL